jgi:trehalose 6-phosphate synthase/phosphatase
LQILHDASYFLITNTYLDFDIQRQLAKSSLYSSLLGPFATSNITRFTSLTMAADSPAIRGKTFDESPNSTRSFPPVTPGVNKEGLSAYIEKSTNPNEPPPPDGASSYFAGSQPEAQKELPDFGTIAPKVQYPALKLTGRVISVTFVVPYAVKISENGDWALYPRKGTSSLFDHFSYLSSKYSGWEHVLVGWTGEVTREVDRKTDALQHATQEFKTLLNASQPIPLDPTKSVQPLTFGPQSINVTATDRKNLEQKLGMEAGGRIVPVWLTDKTSETETYTLSDQKRWCRFSEKILYNLFHYKQNEPSDGREEKKAWADYFKMNQLFADRIMEIYKPGDIVLIHDHQLMRLPSLLRQKIPHIYIGFFLHTPFPTSELYRCLPQRKDLLDGVLGANMIGFQSFSYSSHFSSSCTRVLGFSSSAVGVDAYGARVGMDVLPIGVDAQSILDVAFNNPTVAQKMDAIRKLYPGKKIIVGRDRMDSVRGVAQKLRGFSHFLEMYPEWREKVVLVQITSSSERNPEQGIADRKYVNKVGDLVASINGEYGSLSHAPIQHFPQYLAREEYFALLRLADLGLITSVRDGMNTTSLEYILCQRDHHSPLILSEFSGTAGSLSDAMQVNPWDLHSVALSIHKALTMTEAEKSEEHQKLFQHVIENDIRDWSNKFLRRLLTNLSSYDQSFDTPPLDRSRLLDQYQKAKKRLFMFDYDGTLTPIVMDPQSAIPSDRVLRTLKKLASNPDNHVWIISGRDQNFLEEWMGHIPELGLSAEHGSFVRWPGSDEWENVAAGMDMGWRTAVTKIFDSYTERTQGSFVESKKIALTWHYRRAEHEQGIREAEACKKELIEKVAGEWDVEVMSGKANLEVRPKFVNKGEISKKLIEHYSGDRTKPLGFVLCLGDDFTDEGELSRRI